MAKIPCPHPLPFLNQTCKRASLIPWDHSPKVPKCLWHKVLPNAFWKYNSTRDLLPIPVDSLKSCTGLLRYNLPLKHHVYPLSLVFLVHGSISLVQNSHRPMFRTGITFAPPKSWALWGGPKGMQLLTLNTETGWEETWSQCQDRWCMISNSWYLIRDDHGNLYFKV